ncbi:MAG TPA: COX15/CtaA family protein [Saprospiraceae bacterium]|nr:COX15/CtaA family protein [Saprospiraceae bacterium]
MFKFQYADDLKIPRAVQLWLLTGLVMIFFQIVIGGVTRLTGSGLSITRWDIVTGAIPPMGETAWQAEFDLYKQTPQYQKINQGMALEDFKFIYFWEYFHRLWARLMLVVFIIPFFWFWFKGMLSKRLMPRLLMVVGLAGLEGFFGWIMVASGLIKRPWVNAYNLTLHLCMALVIFTYLMWTWFMTISPEQKESSMPGMRRMSWTLLGLAFVQIGLGAMMSGSKAGLFFPTWPDMHGEYLPTVLLDGSHWTGDSFIHYDTNPFMPALLHFLHRNTAYVLTALIVYFVWKLLKENISDRLRRSAWWLVAAVSVQVLLGIFTVINCKAQIPVDLGVAHQAGAVVLLSVVLWMSYQLRAQRA